MEQATDNMSKLEQETDMPKKEQETDIPKLIEGIKKHICIWDMQAEEYYNRKMYRAAWKSLVPLEDPEQPLEVLNKITQKKKIAALKEKWVDLRNSYFRNGEPGKTYKDSLRFLDCVYQSREIEDILEFDEPSWDLMDVRTWSVKQSQIPKAERRYTDPEPDYKKEIKRPRLDIKEENKTDKHRNKSKDRYKDTNMDTHKVKHAGKAKDKDAYKDIDKDTVIGKDTDKNTDKYKDKGNDKGTHRDIGKDTESHDIKTEEKKKKRSTKKLTILEKAMALYEIENPGVWDSDEEPVDKESRTYSEASTQTDE